MAETNGQNYFGIDLIFLRLHVATKFFFLKNPTLTSLPLTIFYDPLFL